MPKISVIAPVYNMEKYLDQFLNSICKQSFTEYELILADDGSTDRSASILDSYAEKHPEAVVIHKENGGVSSARNAALDLARGEYVYIVDSDDWLDKDALRTLWLAVEETNCDVVFGTATNEKETATRIRKLFPHAFHTENRESLNEIQCALWNNHLIKTSSPDFNWISCLGGPPWRGMFRRDIIEKNGIRYNERLRSLGEDILFWQNIFEYAKSFSYTDELIYHYRDMSNSLSHGFKSNLLDIYRRVFDAEEEFLHTHAKGPEYWEAYYFRVLLYIRQSMPYYFQSKDNPRTKKERYGDFKKLLRSEPYQTAIRTVHLGKLLSRRIRMEYLMLRYGMTRLFWNVMKK